MPNIRILPLQLAVLEAAKKYVQAEDAWLKELLARNAAGTEFDPKTGNLVPQIKELWEAREAAFRNFTTITRGLIAIEPGCSLLP